MDKKLMGLALIFSLILTKPSRDSFSTFLAKDLCFQIKQELLTTACKGLVLFQSEGVKTLIDMNTKVDNYLLFDIYTTKLPLIGLELKTIAIAKNYRVLSIKSF